MNGRYEGLGSFDLRVFEKSESGERGAAAVEFALVLPLLLVMIFGVVDLGRLIQARLIVANVSREGGSMACRSFSFESPETHPAFFALLGSSAAPLDLAKSGIIHISRIEAGGLNELGEEVPPKLTSESWGNLEVPSKIGETPPLGLSSELYNHLTYKGPPQNTSDIREVWVVEVYYKYDPITPLPNFIGVGSTIVGSKAVF
jgi:hypothetical protein